MAEGTAGPAEDGAAATVRMIGLTKRFGDVLAVDDLHLEIPAGSFFALLGPSGCGKTTTLRMIGGQEQPTSGQVLIDADDVTNRKPYKRPVNTVFQSYALFPHLSIFENVAFGLRRTKAKDVRTRVDDMLDLVQLGGYGSRRPSELSGGQQQRVALARALINHPKVLLLDEPLGALDLKLRRQMQLELKRIQTEVGITFVHVTHDQEEAMTMADTIAVMHDGLVEQLGGPVELYERPRTAFVAHFLGQSNLLTGVIVDRDGDGAVVEVAGHRLAVADAGGRGMGAQVSVGVRPEKIHLAAVEDSDDAEDATSHVNGLQGVLEDSSFSGVSTQHTVALPWGQQITVFAQNLGAGEPRPVGSRVGLHWNSRHSFCVEPEPTAGHGATLTDVDPELAGAETPGTMADALEEGALAADVQARP
ncbi:ABC transporter ATP-binding protein [soil metagenome]